MNFWQGRLVILAILGPIAAVTWWLSADLRRQPVDITIDDIPSDEQLKRFQKTISHIRWHLILGFLGIFPAIAVSQYLMATFHTPDEWAPFIQLFVLVAWAINLIVASFRSGMVICPRCGKEFFTAANSGHSHPFSRSCYHCGFKP
jgi:hypothetical protein